MKKNKLKDNPLDWDIDENEIGLISPDVRQYSEIFDVTPEIINKIDFNDKTFINRLYESTENLDIKDLKNSIEEVGLINIIYLWEKKEKYIIVSGLRRSLSCRQLYNENKQFDGKKRVVIFNKEIPYEKLDRISIDENTKRKDLTVLEQSFKFNREAKLNGKSVEEILEKYKISKAQYFRIKNAMNYPFELKEIVDNIGAMKAELISKIVKIEAPDKYIKQIIEENINLSKRELENKLKELKKGIKKNKVELIFTDKSTTIKIREKVPEEIRDYFKNLAKMIENNDYSFLK